MLYRIAADLVVATHFAFVLYVVLGGVFALKWKRSAWVHIPAAVWGVVIEFAGWVCPLTPLENWLREKGGAPGYSGSFVEHYLEPLLYPAALTRGLQIAFGVFALIVNFGVYGYVIWRNARAAISESVAIGEDDDKEF
ncbi:MAG TPA: DUF2784 domain-containing protein [Blastocatellia bacterium]|nr:DUF2784 domain-containing protein [Blastocatellia bacterium]